MSTLSERYQWVCEQIDVASANRQHVSLLAVSKTRSSDEVLDLHRLGQVAFGENYIQEAVDKINDLKEHNIEWHFIGPLQSNKSRLAAENFAWVHTVDRLKIAKRLSDQRPAEQPPLNICLQINIDQEDSKSGFLADDVVQVAVEVSRLPNLSLRGLMAIPKADTTEAEQTRSFQKMADLLQTINQTLSQENPDHRPLDTLSMGMSSDMATAIHCGATVVRIGTAIFGPRPVSPRPAETKQDDH